MDNKLTAVEWLDDELFKLYSDEPFMTFEEFLSKRGILSKQAKAMEKEQISEAHLQGLYSDIIMRGEKQAELYYNETYGKN
jgi:uncharacterized protein YqgQ